MIMLSNRYLLAVPKIQATIFEIHVHTSRIGKRRTKALRFDVCCEAIGQTDFDYGCDRYVILRLDSLSYKVHTHNTPVYGDIIGSYLSQVG